MLAQALEERLKPFAFDLAFYSAGLCLLIHPLRRVPGLRALYAALSETHLDAVDLWLRASERT